MALTDEQSFRRQIMGRRILVRRERAGLSQRVLGERVGVSQATVGTWEDGIAVPSGPTMSTLGRALGVSPHWLAEPLGVGVGEVEHDEAGHGR